MKKYALRNPEVYIEVCQFKLEKESIIKCMVVLWPDYSAEDVEDKIDNIIEDRCLFTPPKIDVRIVYPGDYVVKYKQGAVRVFSEEEFNETYIQIS